MMMAGRPGGTRLFKTAVRQSENATGVSANSQIYLTGFSDSYLVEAFPFRPTYRSQPDKQRETSVSYEIWKTLHILSAFVLFGTGLGIAFFKYMIDRQGDVKAIAVTARHVVLADFLFTTPTVIFQPISGWFLMDKLNITLSEPWVLLTFALYALAGACWLPVVFLQIKMRDMAGQAIARSAPLPEAYHRAARLWFVLGWPAFIALVVIVWLMVTKLSYWVPA